MSLEQAAVRYWSSTVTGGGGGFWGAVLRALLWGLSCGYGASITLRNFLYDHQLWMFKTVRLPVAVVSVGNVAVGGTGKTPFVALLARRLEAMGRRPCILSRGYGPKREAAQNDEYLMLRELLPKVPHLVGKERLLTGLQAVLQFRPEVLVLDDGFQHRKLARNLDIVLVDALEPLGLGHLIPRGRLREPAGELRRADLICLTHSDLVEPARLEKVRERVHRLAPAVPILEAKHQSRRLRPVLPRPATGSGCPTEKLWCPPTGGRDEPFGPEPKAEGLRRVGRGTLSEGRGTAFANWRTPGSEGQPPETLAKKRVAAFCALGSPESFVAELRRLGAEVVHQALFPDHHSPSGPELERLFTEARAAQAELLVCTHKDAVKLPRDLSPPIPVLALEMEMVILRGEEQLEKALVGLPAPMSLRRYTLHM
jgi:tetraacyldisaccharide 4'-kinase